MSKTTNTMTNKLLKAFQSGSNMTAAQITKRFGLAVPRAAVFQLRENGYNIVSNNLKNSRRVSYSLAGQATRKSSKR